MRCDERNDQAVADCRMPDSQLIHIGEKLKMFAALARSNLASHVFR
jgi:hypothetical protein